MSKIIKVEISKLWGKYNLVWESVNSDVNVIVGINGGGKSTLLKIINDCIALQSKDVLKRYFISGCRVTFDDGTFAACGGDFGKSTMETDIKVEYINIFESYFGKNKFKKDTNILDYQLDSLMYQRDANIDNFTNYRLKATSINSNKFVNDNIEKLFLIINKLFNRTQKSIEIASDNVTIQFRDDFGGVISLKDLSSGEKQILIILMKIFLIEDRNYIMLFDEPEISLHIEWQHLFISTIIEMNPNIQIIISTHSPGIFGDGWNDKLTFIEDLVVNK